MTDQQLLAQAEALLPHAHNPYSGIAVSAVVLLNDGRFFGGVNVENSSLGLTICAERNALAQAVAHGPLGGRASRSSHVSAIAFTSNHEAINVPCGACRQVIAELAPLARILYGRDGRILREWESVRDLLPEAMDGRWKRGKDA
jgi:cytidine deaminase